MNAKDKIKQARVSLVLDQAFFGHLILRLPCIADPTAGTMYTDGTKIGYNPKWVDSLTLAEVSSVLCHEVMHCANGHPWRRDGRDHGRWNDACDMAINPVIVEAGMKLPGNCLLDPNYAGKSAEWIYSQFPPPPPKGEQGQGCSPSGAPNQDPAGPGAGPNTPDQDGTGQGPGEVRDCTSDDAKGQEAEWQVAVLQAAAQARGHVPAGMDRRIEEIKHPVIDWKAALRRFVQASIARTDYSWKMPNRRYLGAGLYLPALRSETVPPIVVAIDTSGSIDESTLASFSAELNAIADECKPERVHVIYCDAEISRVDEFAADEPITFQPSGGGGTDFSPVFLHTAQETPDAACIVYLTDLDGCFPEAAPEVPVLWVSTSHGAEVPFGEVIEMGDQQ